MHRWSDQGSRPDIDTGGIEHHAACIQINPVGKVQVPYVGTVKQALDTDIFTDGTKRRAKLRAQHPALAWRQVIVLVNGILSHHAPFLELRIDAAVPFTGLHLLSLCLCHDVSCPRVPGGTIAMKYAGRNQRTAFEQGQLMSVFER